jgi:hypothetical protein
VLCIFALINADQLTKNKYTMKLIIITLITLFASTFSSAQNTVYVEFSAKTTFDDLLELQESLADRNIQLTYKHINVDANRLLKELSFFVETMGPKVRQLGKGELMDFSHNGKITFKIDFTAKGDPALEVKVIPVGE